MNVAVIGLRGLHFYLQHNRGIGLHVEGLPDGREPGTVYLAHPHVRVIEGLRHLSPHRFHFLAVGAPGSIELDEPLSLLADIQEPVAEFQHPRADDPVADQEEN